MKSLQTRRFTEQVQEIIGDNFAAKLKFDNRGEVIESAQINTDMAIPLRKITELDYLADKWDFKDSEISRSGAGLRIRFKDCQFTPQSVN